MNKKLVILFSSAVLLSLPIVTLAGPPALPNTTTNLWDVVVRILGFIWPLFVGFAIVMFLVAGFMFLSANGDPGKIRTGRDAVIWGSVGVVVGILAFSFPFIIGTTLGL